MHGSHSHNHGDSHGAVLANNERRMGLAAALTGAFMLAEVAGGIAAGSLALPADAGHMLTDFASLALAWFGFRLSRRPADWRRTYGFDRFQVLVAFANRFGLLSHAPRRGPDRDHLNLRGAAIHVLGDLLGSVAALIAGGVILFTGWTPIDPLLSLVVAVIIVRSGWQVVADAGHILLEGAPEELDTRAIGPDLVAKVKGVEEIPHVHVWSITQSRRMVTLHALVAETEDSDQVVRNIKARLKDKFGLDHATVEIERGACADAEPQRSRA